MKSQQTLALTTTAAFVGGFVAGIVYMSEPCRRFRATLGESAQQRKRWAEEQLRTLEDQIGQLEAQLQNVGEEFARRIRSEGSDGDSERKTWKVAESEVERDLPRMPRS